MKSNPYPPFRRHIGSSIFAGCAFSRWGGVSRPGHRALGEDAECLPTFTIGTMLAMDAVTATSSKRAFVQWHAGEGLEKSSLTMILDTEGAPVLMIGAMEELSLQDAACCIALCTNGHSEHLAFCAGCVLVLNRGAYV